MALERRKLGKLLILASVAVVVLATRPADAQTDLNRFFPKVSTNNEYEEDLPPRPPKAWKQQKQPPSRSQTRQPTSQKSASPRENRGPATQASYQPSVPNYQNPRRYNPMGAGAGRPQMSGQRSFPNLSSPRSPPPRTAMNSKPTSGANRAPEANGQLGASVVVQKSPPEPIVTPDAVYLDVEPIATGKPTGANSAMSGNGSIVYEGPMLMDGKPMTEGRSFLPGGPIMGRTYDGFTNPYCNDCCGSACANGGCGLGGCGSDGCGDRNCGPQCGYNYGMYGGCEKGYDGCGGCGPRYGPFNGPYGRPWILAPIDWLIGGLWHTGPYWGDCYPCRDWWWGQDFTVFGGVHNFKSPVDIDGNSNFGFQEGVNWSTPFWASYGIGAQIGVGVTQSNFQSSDLYDEYRTQVFLTTGLFHRPSDGQGWQYGVVFDWLHDDFYQRFDVGQLRGELSWLWDCQNEIGFWFAAGVLDADTANDQILFGATEYEAIDQYAFFYRRRFNRGGDGRIWGGFTGNGGGLIGADLSVPIAKCWALESSFNYIIDENTDNPIFHDETWNVGLNLVCYWGCNANGRSDYRPLFNVADNGSFMVTRRGLIVP